MSRIAIWTSRVVVLLTAAALAVVSLAPQPAYALGLADTATPPGPDGQRLQRAWAREQRLYGRLGEFFSNADSRLARAQELIDQAKANGKDVTALQAALDAFGTAVKQARPVYDSAKGIVASHQGFDEAGNVTDPVKALETVQDMRAKLVEVRRIGLPAARDLRQAVREFRQANNPVAPTPTP